MEKTRRRLLQGMVATGFVAGTSTWGDARVQGMQPDLILRNGQFTTLDRSNPQADAVAIKDGRFIAAGLERDVMVLAGSGSKVIDLKGRRVLPGLIDSHMHIIRGGLNYNMELRWDGVRSPGRRDAHAESGRSARTPPPQWVRVVGGFTEHQFAEKRLPTLEEINAVAPDTPVFILHLYDRALLNARGAARGRLHQGHAGPAGRRDRARRAWQSDRPADRQAERDHPLRHARQGAEAAARVPDQFDAAFHARAQPAGRDGRDRCRRRLPELPRGLRRSSRSCTRDGQLTRAHRLQPLHPEAEGGEGGLPALDQAGASTGQGDDYFRHNGAGEMLVFSRRRFRGLPGRASGHAAEMEGDLEPVVRILAENRWPWRLHATYDETISRALDVFEKVNRDIPLDGPALVLRPCETITDRNIDRIADARRRHRRAAPHGLPGRVFRRALRRARPPNARRRFERMLEMGVPDSARHRCDARRVLQPLGLALLAGHRHDAWGLAALSGTPTLDRETALRMWTESRPGSPTRRQEGSDQGRTARRSGRARPRLFLGSRRGDPDIASVLTMVGGKAVYGAGDFADLAPPLPPAMPDWSPVRTFGGYQKQAAGADQRR